MAGVCLLGCSRPANEYSLSRQAVLSQESSLRGEIYIQEGANGPYQVGPGFVGTIGSAGSITVPADQGPKKFSYPATPGYFFEGTAYLNKDRKAFVVIRRVPASAVEAEK
ncbi:MAG TPA: hypothetical protein VIS74_04080 [Chthoniobacterales bacterium]